MGRRRALVDLPKDRRSMMDHSVAPTERRAARGSSHVGLLVNRPHIAKPCCRPCRNTNDRERRSCLEPLLSVGLATALRMPMLTSIIPLELAKSLDVGV